MININSYLRKLASELFISHNSRERNRINASVSTVEDRLTSYFGDKLQSLEVFGSYTRDTILPWKYDNKADVDIMIVFDTESHYEREVSTYRENLRNFANHWYSTSVSKKDFPSVVIQMQRLKLDLVPAITKWSLWNGTRLVIPDNNDGWMPTDPFSFSEELTEANITYNNIVKPIVRLLKFWNGKSAGYPFPSFVLEQLIANMDFSNDDIQSGFFYAIQKLPIPDNYKYAKVESLKENAIRVQEYLEEENKRRAMNWLYRILPYTQ